MLMHHTIQRIKEEIKLDRKIFLEITESAFRKWIEYHASIRAAALSYFIILPLPSLFLIIMVILSQIYGQTEAFQTLIQQITTVAGPAVANLIQQILETVATPFTSIITSIITIIFTLAGAIGAFGVLQDTMNAIWGVTQMKLTFIQRLKHKIGPFLLVSALGLVILVWTGITTVLLDFITFTFVPLASTTVSFLLQIIQMILSFALATMLFAFMYKRIPDLPVRWRDVRLAATITGLIFTVTNYLIGVVLEVFTITSVTGAAGALMILLLWIYLITQLIIYGAAFSRVYAERIGSYSSN
jgi:membrane protein